MTDATPTPDTSRPVDTLADALPSEIARVTAIKERWQAHAREFPKMATGMSIGIAFMASQIDLAIRTLASGDVVAMLKSYESLRGYDDDA